MSKIDHIARAAINSSRNRWGSWAARRYVMNACGYNEKTAIACLRAAKVCIASNLLEGNVK